MLEGEEGHVVVAGDLERSGPAGLLRNEGREGGVDEALVGTALLPDAGVDSAFDEDEVGIVGGDADVAGGGWKRWRGW
jgi:hypothetical protein